MEVQLLLRLIIAYTLAAFYVPLLKGWLFANSGQGSWPRLILHSGFAAIIAYILSGKFNTYEMPLLFLLLWPLKFGLKPQKENLFGFFIEHLLSILALSLAWIALQSDTLNRFWEMVKTPFLHPKFWPLVLAYLLVTQPAGIFIGIVTEKWRSQLKEVGVETESLPNAGKLIGITERILILTFVLVNQYEAIGLLIAAKSLLRMRESGEIQKKSEYILIGTLCSFATALAIGLLVKQLI